MLRQEFTDTVKRRFDHRSDCPICKRKIEIYDDVQYVKYPWGCCTMYTFFHSQCLVQHELNPDSFKVEGVANG